MLKREHFLREVHLSFAGSALVYIMDPNLSQVRTFLQLAFLHRLCQCTIYTFRILIENKVISRVIFGGKGPKALVRGRIGKFNFEFDTLVVSHQVKKKTTYLQL